MVMMMNCPFYRKKFFRNAEINVGHLIFLRPILVMSDSNAAAVLIFRLAKDKNQEPV